MQKTIYVVDDNDTNLITAKEALKDQYRVMTLPSAARMFSLIDRVPPDLILLDIEMPDMDGFEALAVLKENSEHAGIPVIFLTSMTDTEIEVKGFQLGVVDFITKPFSPPVLTNRVRTHLNIDDIIRERTAQLQHLQNGIIYVLADMVESRDEGTGGHVDRTAIYIEILMKAMIENNLHAEELRDMDMESLVSSARLHDVGKIAISDTILNKPGRLDDQEFAIMKTHTIEGEKFIDQIISRTGSVEFLTSAKLFAGYHHERWDGQGYPYRLQHDEIPLLGRIMAIADVYDALISVRPYKKPFSHEEATKIIMENAGTQFDADIADIFYQVRDEFEKVASEMQPPAV
ncbi:MAG: response regulator [Oscillospiraceae bacterium]|nr:response regulator [Oscillospiraceae bacterium]